MHVGFAVFLLLIAYAVSYPALREAANDNDESNNDLELELRSILNHFNAERDTEEQMTRSLASDESDDDDEDSNDNDDFQVSKRQGGRNTVDQQSKCEITCIHQQRFPTSGGKGKTIKDASKACRNVCGASSKKRTDKKAQKKPRFDTRALNDERRALFDLLTADNNDE